MLGLFKKRKARASAATGSVASAGVPDSGFAFINNSQGASNAIAELSTHLDEALDRIELDGEPDDQIRFHLDQLDAEASKYVNCRIDETQCCPWTCSRRVAIIADVAVKCSIATYDENISLEMEEVTFTSTERVEAAEAGLAKSVLCTLATPKSASKACFVFAIRGSASVLDYMVNLNGDAKEVGDFIRVESLSRPQSASEGKLKAHSGFIGSANAILPLLIGKLKHLESQHVRHVLFTGHSAGAAVASLLYAHCRTEPVFAQKFMFSLITFGSPPTISCDLSERFPSQSVDRSNKTILLNFVNEFDLVARSSKSYIRSLVDLFRSIYTLPPIHDHGTIEQDWKVLNGFGPQFEGDGALPTPRLQNLPFWNVPSPELFHVGPIVALKAGYSGKSNAALAGRDWDLRAFSVPHEEFSKLLFCRVSVHARQIYVENLNDISKGLLNGGTGWNYKMIHDD